VNKARARSPTRLGRIAAYLAVTFPPLAMLVAAAVSFAAVYFLLEALARHGRLEYTWRAVGAMLTCYSLSLLLRIYDELKDVETDRRLAAGGDPKYVERPIVRGLVDVEDLHALRWAVSTVALLVSVFLGPVLFGAFGVLYATTWLSSRWFFWPKMRDHLMIAFATHNPLTLLLQAFAALAYVEDFGLGALGTWPLVATLVGQQGLASAWEVARKIRAPAQETDYVTYSKVLGWRAASMLPLAAVLVSAACIEWVSSLAGLHALYLAAVGASAAAAVVALLRFRVAPSAKTSKLRPYIEAFAAVANVGGLAALVARWGVALGPIK
jgi:4-hydroxybenzoate polyprenyltransferase